MQGLAVKSIGYVEGGMILRLGLPFN